MFNKKIHRTIHDKIIISTLTHFLSLYFIRWNDYVDIVYSCIIIISTTLSVTWHYYHEPSNIIMFLDYLFACLWVIVEIFIAIHIGNVALIFTVLFMNAIVFGLNKCIDIFTKYNTDEYEYERLHTWWHIVSALKSVCITAMISI
jgi:hypothetical protein